MSAVVRPLRLTGTHVLSCLTERASLALHEWASEWSRAALPEGAVQVEPVCASLSSIGPCLEFVAPGGRLWVRMTTGDQDVLAGAVLGREFLPLSNNADAWSRAALGEAMNQRNVSLAKALVGQPSGSIQRQPADDVFAFGSGAVQIRCEALGLFAIADAGALAHVPPLERPAAKHVPLRPLLDSARSAPVSLVVSLGSVELSLSHLMGLEVGDVVCLPTRLSDLVPVTLEGQPLARASLGRIGLYKAVQLVSLESSPMHGVTR